MADEDGSPENLEEVVDQLEDKAASKDETVTVDEALDAFEGRTFGPLLILPALVALVPPIGMIPFVPTTMGVIVILIASQYLFGRTHPWVPDMLGRRNVKKQKVLDAVNKSRPWAKRVDGFLGPRLQMLVEGPMEHVIAGLCVLLALTMPLCELIPGLAAVPAAAILFLGLAITVKDGLLGLIGIVVAASGLAYMVFRLPDQLSKLSEWFG